MFASDGTPHALLALAPHSQEEQHVQHVERDNMYTTWLLIAQLG